MQQCPSLGNDIVPNLTGSLLAFDSVYRYMTVDLDNKYLFTKWLASSSSLFGNGLDLL